MRIGKHTITRTAAMLMAVFMLCTCLSGVFGGIVLAEGRDGEEVTRLYAFRSWSENADEQRDFVTFTTDDLNSIESLWPYPAGMVAAEYFGGTLYVVDENLGFSAVNIEDGSAVSIRTLDMIVNDMTFDYTSGTMFFLTYSYAVNGKQIGILDLETGEMTIMGTFPSNIYMTTISAGRQPGVFYGVDDTGIVYSFDVYANCTQIADTGAGYCYGSSATYCYADDMLYWEQNPGQNIVRIDPASGEVSVLGTLPHYTTLTGITTIPDPEDLPEQGGGSPVTEVILNVNEMLLAPGLSKQLSVTIVPFDTADPSVTWSSSDESVAAVDENGLVTGVSAGEAVITVTSVDGGHTDACSVRVTDDPTTFLAFRLYAMSGPYGDYISFTDVDPGSVQSKWQGTFELYGSEYVNGVLYGSDYINNRFVTIDVETGEMTPIGFCPYAFTGLSYDYEAEVMYGISYANGSNQTIFAIDTDTAELTEICTVRGYTQFYAFTHARNGNFYGINGSGELCIIDDHGFVEVVGATPYSNVFSIQSMTYDYKSDSIYWANAPSGELIKLDPETAECVSLGVIGEGMQFTALTVVRDEAYSPAPADDFPVTGVIVEPDALTLAPGISEQLSALIYPWNAGNKAVTWTSSDTSVATVDENGCVTGVGGGVANITATTQDGGFTASSAVTVLEDGIELRGSRLYSNGMYGDLIKFTSYELPTIVSLGYPRSEIYAGEYYDGTFYGFAQQTRLLFAIDDLTGDSRVIGPCYYDVYEMAYDYLTGNMYCMVLVNGAKQLARIDINTAEITLVGAFDAPAEIITLCGSRNGGFYGISFSGDLYHIDASAHCELVGATGFVANYQQSMTYDYRSDSIYWAQYPDGLLVRVDPATGAGENLGALEYAPEIGGLYTVCAAQYLPERLPGAPVTGIHSTFDSAKLAVGGVKQLAVTVEPFDAGNRNVVWTSADTSVAIVNEAGLVTALSEGEVVVTAATEEGGYLFEFTVTVTNDGTALYAYRNNGIDKANDWVRFSDVAPDTLTSLWDAEQEIYGAAYYDGYLYIAYRFSGLVRADIESGEYTVIGFPQSGYQIWGMTYDYTSDIMFVTVYNESNGNTLLGKIDLETAQIYDMVEFSGAYNVKAIAAGRDGLYAVDGSGTISKVTEGGVCTPVLSLGIELPFLTALAYDYATDTFIWSQNCWGFNQDSYLVRVDVDSGSREYLGIIGEGGNQPILTALVLIPDPQDLPGVLPGDVDLDGNVTLTDALMALRQAMGLLSLDARQFRAADMNGDGTVEVTDAVTIMRTAMGLL